MKSFEIQQTGPAESEEDIRLKALELRSSAFKALESIQDDIGMIRRHAEKIDDSSTKTFIGSFLSDIGGIRSSYENIALYFEDISKLRNMHGNHEIDATPKSDIGDDDVSCEKEEYEANQDAETANVKQRIRWNILETINNIDKKINAAKHPMRYFTKRSNGDGILEEIYNCLNDLNAAIAKLDRVEADMEEYIKK